MSDDKAKEYFNKFIENVKDAGIKTGKFLGKKKDQGFIKVEIFKLNNKIKEQHETLGKYLAESFLVKESSSISKDDETVVACLEEIKRCNLKISELETEYKIVSEK